jgi:hypothetical protein
MKEISLAYLDDHGSSNTAQTIGLSFCHRDNEPEKKSSSQPNFFAISSCVGGSESRSRFSITCRVSCVSLQTN